MAAKNFWEAVNCNDLSSIIRFVEAGTSVDVEDGEYSYLHSAVYNGHFKTVQYLVEQGANINAMYGGQSVIAYAKKSGQDSIANYLESKIAERHPWSLFSPTKLAHVEISVPLNRKITEIFNMESQDRMTISENLSAKTEAILPLTPFNELPKDMVEKITAKFIELGGETSETSIPNKPRYVLEGKKPAAAPK